MFATFAADKLFQQTNEQVQGFLPLQRKEMKTNGNTFEKAKGESCSCVEVVKKVEAGYRAPSDSRILFITPPNRKIGIFWPISVSISWALGYGRRGILLRIVSEYAASGTFWSAVTYRLLQAFSPRKKCLIQTILGIYKKRLTKQRGITVWRVHSSMNTRFVPGWTSSAALVVRYGKTFGSGACLQACNSASHHDEPAHEPRLAGVRSSPSIIENDYFSRTKAYGRVGPTSSHGCRKAQSHELPHKPQPTEPLSAETLAIIVVLPVDLL